MALFRFHRGSLSDSLKSTVIIKNLVDLMDVISKRHEKLTGERRQHFGVLIGPYPEKDNNFDERIGWYTQMVTSDILQQGVFVVEGYLSEPIE